MPVVMPAIFNDAGLKGLLLTAIGEGALRFILL